ncbi:hypothetical protein BB776_03490 [Planococcus salinarum]|uniref:Uncharacterized protein n=1 Tax=Planococcus salinarum TaxID=622695 RepID=A0ABX3D1K0_9BACL|nr:hypothetical protein [Planococcus salinarum]OHX51213.1 hypothetical protein BB776_03490 [Planococcus salinarum]
MEFSIEKDAKMPPVKSNDFTGGIFYSLIAVISVKLSSLLSPANPHALAACSLRISYSPTVNSE